MEGGATGAAGGKALERLRIVGFDVVPTRSISIAALDGSDSSMLLDFRLWEWMHAKQKVRRALMHVTHERDG